jgi:hypothetical protein
MSDYTQGLLGRANAVAAQPYETYGGPRIAGMTGDTNTANDMVRSNAGSSLPWLQQAGTAATNAANGPGALTASQPYFNTSAAGVMDALAPGRSAASAANPYVQSGFDVTGSALNPALSGSAAASNYFTKAAGTLGGVSGGVSGPGALASASPYLTSASKTLPGNISDYLNPYTQNVIDKSKLEARRFYDESLMPSMTDTFTNAGQFGSSRMAEVMNKGVRDITEGLQTNANAALSDAWNTAGTQFGADMNRIAGIGATAANAAGTDQSNQVAAQRNAVDAGAAMGALGQYSGNLANQNVQNIINAGRQFADMGTTMGNFANLDTGNRLQGSQQLGALGQYAGNAANQQTQTGLDAAQTLANVGTNISSANTRDAAALDAIGTRQQNLDQQNLTMAYQDFLAQRAFPQQQVDWLSNIIRGVPNSAVGQATTTTATGPSNVYQPSPLATLAAMGTGMAGWQQAMSGGTGTGGG